MSKVKIFNGQGTHRFTCDTLKVHEEGTYYTMVGNVTYALNKAAAVRPGRINGIESWRIDSGTGRGAVAVVVTPVGGDENTIDLRFE